jgi:ligand-binding SRPBCC domain-containing protein
LSRIELCTEIGAPIERCFDLSRSVEAHERSTVATSERAVAGRTSGLFELGDEVTWRATHLGVSQLLSVRISAFDRPRHFRDEMVRGAFRRFTHDHYFSATATGTTMRDVFDFAAPLGPLGRLAERLFLTGYMRRFLEKRNLELKAAAESDDWKKYLPGGG